MLDVYAFQEVVEEFYRAHGRHQLPWRQPASDGQFDPYAILVSEVMLQQTQVGRVIPAYQTFMARFPSVAVLASAPLAAVLTAWSGLGYNRRAKYLHQAAQIVMRDFGGQLPATATELTALPGVGPNTAGALLAYAYNQDVVFLETNIRTVIIHHFFARQEKVHDRDIAAVVAQTLPPGRAREWYWALMDYGTHLKQTVGNAARASAHHSVQTRFAGSRRQLRGQVLRRLTEGPSRLEQLQRTLADERLPAVLADLQHEGFIEQKGKRISLSS